MTLLLPFRRALQAGPWARNELWRRAKAVYSLDLDFAGQKTLDPRITFTHASSGTYVGSDGLIKTATTNEARFDHNPTTRESLGLLVEESRTNLFQYSEEFDNAYWSKANLQGTLTANQAVAPDGATTADLYQEDTATTGRYLARSISFTSGTTYSFSCWAKQAPGATRYLGLILPSSAFGTNTAASFTLSGAGSFTISISGTNTSAQIQAFPNGWYRCTLISQATATTSTSVQIRLSSSATSAANSWTGDNTSGLYLWGAQLEAAAFPTSYIPTTTATVTRSADVASITGANFSSWYRQDEGTLYTAYSSQATNATRFAASLTETLSASSSNRIQFSLNTSNVPSYALVAAGTTQGTLLPGGTAPNYVTAYSYKLNDLACSSSGNVVVTDTTADTPTGVAYLNIGANPAGSTGFLNGTIRRLTYWPFRLPNSTLQEITR